MMALRDVADAPYLAEDIGRALGAHPVFLHHTFKEFDGLAVLGQGNDGLLPRRSVALGSSLAAEMSAHMQGVDLADLYAKELFYRSFDVNLCRALCDFKGVLLHADTGHAFFRDNGADDDVLCYHCLLYTSRCV